MKNAVLGAVALAVLAGAANAQVKWFKWDGNVAIPDNTGPTGGFVSVFIDVPNSGNIEDLNVDLIIAHTWQGDIVADLVAPGGQTVRLLDRVGNGANPGVGVGFSADNFGNPATGAKFILDDSAAAAYDNTPNGTVASPGIANVSGAWKPHSPLSAFNGLNKQGRWELRVSDWAGLDLGSVRNFGLTFTVPAPGAVALFGAAGLAAARRRR